MRIKYKYIILSSFLSNNLIGTQKDNNLIDHYQSVVTEVMDDDENVTAKCDKKRVSIICNISAVVCGIILLGIDYFINEKIAKINYALGIEIQYQAIYNCLTNLHIDELRGIDVVVNNYNNKINLYSTSDFVNNDRSFIVMVYTLLIIQASILLTSNCCSFKNIFLHIGRAIISSLFTLINIFILVTSILWLISNINDDISVQNSEQYLDDISFSAFDNERVFTGTMNFNTTSKLVYDISKSMKFEFPYGFQCSLPMFYSVLQFIEEPLVKNISNIFPMHHEYLTNYTLYDKECSNTIVVEQLSFQNITYEHNIPLNDNSSSIKNIFQKFLAEGIFMILAIIFSFIPYVIAIGQSISELKHNIYL